MRGSPPGWNRAAWPIPTRRRVGYNISDEAIRPRGHARAGSPGDCEPYSCPYHHFRWEDYHDGRTYPGYNEVCTYAASVHYGVDGHARFTLYKLGYRADDERRGKNPVVLLGDADYVLKL